jgi:hypothetical protein
MGWGYTWKICFENFIKNFNPISDECTVFIDNSSDATVSEVIEICNKHKFNYKITNDGNSIGFFKVWQIAYNNDDDVINYFVESDYLHRKGSKEALIEIFSSFAKDQYVTLYDHPDKYYPFHWDTNTRTYRNYCDLQDNMNIKSKIHYLQSGWWRTVPTTCFTFACTTKVLREDFEILRKWTEPFGTERGRDFDMFNEIIGTGRELYSPIPSYSGHTTLLPTGVDWTNI